ncbi:MAG: hypothetical protein HY644_09685 [Acidobacteria bacterium]|nr:hypothetical protein [Acidobacteriota bacterium]
MWQRLAFMILCSAFALQAQDSDKKPTEKEQVRQKALSVIERSIESMGGPRFRQVQEIKSKGHYYVFKDGQTAGVAKYFDYTRLPDKSRFQLGEGKNREVTIFDLSTNKGWHLEGKNDIKEASAEEIRQFRQTVRHSVENLLRKRLQEPGMNFFYYGSGEVSGRDDVEAVEMIDAENDSVLIYFDLKTYLPSRLEYVTVDARGNKRREAVEFYIWHSMEGVMTPLRLDNYTGGQLSSQLFVDEITYRPTPAFNDALFSRPTPEK